MNSLSWMLYASDALPSLAKAVQLIAILGLVGIGFWGFVSAGMNAEPFPSNVPTPKLKWAIWLTAVLLIFCLIPGERTILLIAASEAAETYVSSETGKAMMDKLNAAIDAQLDSLAAPK